MKKPKLSDTPSTAIRQAIDDLKAVEKMKEYVVDMDGSWHNMRSDGKCHLCLAGAVIARAGNDPLENLAPGSFDRKLSDKLEGIDHFRTGCIAAGLADFNKKVPRILTDEVRVTPYYIDPRKFKKEMLEIAESLEALGL